MKNITISVGVALALGGVLASCGTPQQRCIAGATRDMKVVERLMAEAQGNLQRGYALESETVYRTEFQDCTPAPTAAHPNPAPQLCPVEVPSTTTRPVAIDLAAESAKLASLQAKYAQQGTMATQAIAQCRAVHPE
jgi:hypothetical protein